MSGQERVLYEVRDRIAFLTIHRPEKLNALDRATVRELDRAVQTSGDDPAVGALILTGSGEKAFVAGADIGELSRQTPVEGAAFSRAGQAVLTRLERLGKPSIAAINGYALGGGLELALACTLRVASETARLGLPEVTLAIIPGYGGTQRLARLIGQAGALEMILTGEPVEAREAHRLGLVNRVVPAADLLKSAEALARTILARGPIAVRLALQAVQSGLDMPLEDGLGLEAALFGLTCASEDMREGTAAFLEKRRPEFRGR